MLMPNLAALAVNIVAFFLIFRSRIPHRFSTERIGDFRTRAGYRTAAAGLAIALVALLACGLVSIPLAFPALIVGALLTLVSCARRQSSLAELRDSVTWSLFPFIQCIVLRQSRRHCHAPHARRGYRRAVDRHSPPPPVTVPPPHAQQVAESPAGCYAIARAGVTQW